MTPPKISLFLLGLLLAVTTSLLPAQPAAAAADGCDDGYSTDFDGDGFSDTVVADPYATVAGQAQAGRVVVRYGDDGRIGEGTPAVLSQGSGEVLDAAEPGDRFGFSLAVGDVNCDDFTDLVVGSPYEDSGSAVNSGLVQIIWGAAGGLGTGDPSRQLSQGSFGEAVRAGDQFGYAVDLLEDVGQGGTPAPDAFALGIGAPGFDVGGDNDAGWVGIAAPLDGGSLTHAITQDSPGISGAAEPGDRFGASISINYLVGETGTVDVAVGAPNEDIGSLADAGQVTIIRDVYDEGDGALVYDQNSAGVPGSAEAGDRFGRSLDSIAVGATSRLAVGIPGEDVGSVSNAGSVQLFSRSGGGLVAGTALTQNTAGVGDASQTGDLFGDKVAFAPGGAGAPGTKLAVSAPDEDGAANATGLVQVFPMSDLDSEDTYTQSTAGVPGVAEAGDRFGSSVAIVTGGTEQALIVGVPDDVGNSTGMVNVIPLGAGAARFWAPGTGGIPGAGSSRFGDALATSGS